MDLLVLVIIVGAFVMMLMLPMRRQQRLARESQAMQSALQVGDEVMTTSGMYGRIAALGDNTVDLEISEDVVVRWSRGAIREVTNRVGGADETEYAEDSEPDTEPDSEPDSEPDTNDEPDDDDKRTS